MASDRAKDIFDWLALHSRGRVGVAWRRSKRAQPSVTPGAGSRFDCFGYGSLRGTALGGPDRDVPLKGTTGLETLFLPNARLIHAETWLRREALRAGASARDRAFFESVLATVASLLPNGERIAMHGDEVVVETPNGQFPLSAMSDGYLTTLGWTIDLIARWAHKYRDTGKLDHNFAKDMPCVVLVDELDLHLHPRWQLEIIPRLRAAFPKTTFIVTTHNPLTLHGARPGEVFVLTKDETTGNVSIAQRDLPPGLDANRILTGDWFGLPSTLDESTLTKLDQHREMLLAHSPENDRERLALERELRERLNGFADTSIERIAHGVVAELLDAKMRARKDITSADRERVVAEVRKRLAALDGDGSAAREPPASYRPRPPTPKATPRRTPTTKPAKAKAKAPRTRSTAR
ncbi:MAG: AAA family ATPase [Deltaproteobacteria bacterium]|nr:AAA family ATPase [Deltaproteobacteria bacterium]